MVYATSGQPTATVVKDGGSLIDTTLYWIAAQTEREAYYLVGIINSDALKTALAPLMPKGQFGARHVHKHLWRLPIPEYDEADPLHRGIAEAAAAAARGAEALLGDLRRMRAAQGKAASVTVVRREIRAWLVDSEEGAQVERLAARLLGGGRG